MNFGSQDGALRRRNVVAGFWIFWAWVKPNMLTRWCHGRIDSMQLLHKYVHTRRHPLSAFVLSHYVAQCCPMPMSWLNSFFESTLVLLRRFRCAESERHLSPFGTVLRRCRSSVVPEKYDLWANPPPAPPLGNKTDPEPLSILHQLGWAGIPDKAKLKLRCTGKLFAGHKRTRN